MIIGIRNGNFLAAEHTVWLPGGQVITKDNLPAGWREVDPPTDPGEQEPAPIAHTPGQWVEQGQAVAFDGVTYTARQRHLMQADWTPPLLALWLRVNDGEDWVPGEQVEVGTRRRYENVWYEALQAHVTQTGWEPPTVPALWALVPEEPEPGEDWVDTGATVTGQAGQLYYVSTPIANLNLAAGQAIKLGDAETTYVSTWVGTDNLMQINPYVAASVGAKVWKWA